MIAGVNTEERQSQTGGQGHMKGEYTASGAPIRDVSEYTSRVCAAF